MSTSIAQWKDSLCTVPLFLSNKIAESAQMSLSRIFIEGKRRVYTLFGCFFFLVQSSWRVFYSLSHSQIVSLKGLDSNFLKSIPVAFIWESSPELYWKLPTPSFLTTFFRSLNRHGLITFPFVWQHQSYLVDVWYMLNSVAFELEYLTTLNKTLQNLVNEELSRSFRPVLEDDDRTVRLI